MQFNETLFNIFKMEALSRDINKFLEYKELKRIDFRIEKLRRKRYGRFY